MISLIKAEVYKQVSKRSFIILVLLIIFVSILSLFFINKNISLEKVYYDVYPLLSKEEYLDVNKYGSYEHYLKKYKSYERVVNKQNLAIFEDSNNRAGILLSYSFDFIFILGFLIIILAFHSYSYDFQSESLKYVYLSREGRKKIYFSKLLSIILLTLFLVFLLLFFMLITSSLLTQENILKMIFNGNFNMSILKNLYLVLFPLLFTIIFTIFMCLIFKGGNFGLVLCIIIYLSSLVIGQIFLKYGFTQVQYTFLPYIDFTYFLDKVQVSLNNAIYDVNLGVNFAFIMLSIYSILFVMLSLKLIKRDI